MKSYQIETARLRMRVFKPEDLPEYHAKIYGDADVMRYLPGGVPRPIEGTQSVLEWAIDHFNTYGFTMWAVFDKANGAFLGHCGIVKLRDTEDFELAYAFAKPAWGKGFAPEAARASLRYGFESAGLDIIYAMAFPENINSQRVMQKIGMKHEGLTDRYHNANLVLYSLKRADFVPNDDEYRVIEA